MIARKFENIKEIKIDERSAEFTDILPDLEPFDPVLTALLGGFFVLPFDLDFFDDSHSEAL